MTSLEILHLLERAYAHAHASPDPATQNGALVLCARDPTNLAGGHNHPTPDATPARYQHDRLYRLRHSVHAEAAALATARLRRLHLTAATMVCCWAACPDCARLIADSGIGTLVRHTPPHRPPRPEWHLAEGDRILHAAGVQILNYSGLVGTRVRFDGETLDV
jgi:deoxycytidylate deaminase